MSDYRKISSSFRDPNGYLFIKDQILYRQINRPYTSHYHKLHESGLYENLVKKGWITPYTEANIEPDNPEIAYLVVQPEQLPFISYPYEWCFSKLKDAALLTL